MMLLADCGSKTDPEFFLLKPISITIRTYYNGEQLVAFNSLADEFNSAVGGEHGIADESSGHGSVSGLEANVLGSADGMVSAAPMPGICSACAGAAHAPDEMDQIANLRDYLNETTRAAFIEEYAHVV